MERCCLEIGPETDLPVCLSSLSSVMASSLSLNNRARPGFVYTPSSAPLAHAISSTRHVLNSQAASAPGAKGDLTLLLTAIQTTCKFIATNVRRARLLNLCAHLLLKLCWGCLADAGSRIGAAGVTNVQGEEQKKLDVLSNDIMVNSLRASGKTALMVSEEIVRPRFSRRDPRSES